MSWRRCWSVLVFVVMFAMGSGAWVGEAYAQPAWSPNISRGGDLALGLSVGSWGLPEPLDDTKRSRAFDISVQQGLGSTTRDFGETALRVQVGRGSRYSSEGEDFHYRRVMVGAVREFSMIPSRRPWVFIHVGGALGAYRVSTAAGKHETRSSLLAQAGFDVRLGPTAFTLGPEYQVHTIGDRLYDTASIVARFRRH
jgi:hypothetical protein